MDVYGLRLRWLFPDAGWMSVFVLCAATISGAVLCGTAVGQVRWPAIMPEERAVSIRDPACLPRARIPAIGPPITIAMPPENLPKVYMSLDEAIRISLENSEVIRVLTGVQAVASGSTIYDVPISNTSIDEQKGRFDPAVEIRNNFNRLESPVAVFDPLDPTRAVIGGTRTDNYDLDLGLSKTTRSGASARLGVRSNPTRFQPGVYPLNPNTSSSIELSLTQPLLQGGGYATNLAPIVIARIDTERSYFRFKGNMQQMVGGVIDAYWSLVFARINRWARRQQVKQAEKAYEIADAKRRHKIIDIGEFAQTELAFANFKASLVLAEANVLSREASLRNILGLLPSHEFELVPISPPSTERLPVDWDDIVAMAEERRPDLIELKLVIEADQQRLLQANNRALPRVDAVALYRWNGLEGEMPVGSSISSGLGESTDWTLGVTFSVPLGLRESRAGLRRQELIIARDRANLDQGMHKVVHVLAGSVRNIDYLYAQYEALTKARKAARVNLDLQTGEHRAGRVIFLNVLQAITAWGDAVSGEAQALTLYNTELANLERETGTILETHGVTFVEERYGAIGPLGRSARHKCYPNSIRPGPNVERYPCTDKPSEESFNLTRPKPEQLPLPSL